MIAEEKRSPNEAVRLKIEQRAYEIWQSEGSSYGYDVDHWLRAEAETKSSQSATGAADVENRSAPVKANPDSQS